MEEGRVRDEMRGEVEWGRDSYLAVLKATAGLNV